MSEPGTAPGRDALLATKLHVPRLPPGFVARPRLTARLDEGLAGRMILVSAPAGFGKTAADSQGRTGSIIEIAALRALALTAAGDRAAAAQDLARTLPLAAQPGYVRVFADEGPPMAALLSQVAAAHRDGQPAARQVPLG